MRVCLLQPRIRIATVVCTCECDTWMNHWFLGILRLLTQRAHEISFVEDVENRGKCVRASPLDPWRRRTRPGENMHRKLMKNEKKDSKLGSKQSYRSKVDSPVPTIGAGHLAALSVQEGSPQHHRWSDPHRAALPPSQSEVGSEKMRKRAYFHRSQFFNERCIDCHRKSCTSNSCGLWHYDTAIFSSWALTHPIPLRWTTNRRKQLRLITDIPKIATKLTALTKSVHRCACYEKRSATAAMAVAFLPAWCVDQTGVFGHTRTYEVELHGYHGHSIYEYSTA